MPRWVRNIPLPEPHLVALGVGVVVRATNGWTFPLPSWLRLVGLGVVGAGLALVAWAIWASAHTYLADPDRLVTAGPFTISRNPMYVGWTLAYVGVALTIMDVWLFVLLPAVLVATHLTVGREERRLRDRFGPLYTAYAAKVRRYV